MPARTARRFAIPSALSAAFLLALALQLGRGGGGQATTSLSVTDQLGRPTPFFLCGQNSTRRITARLMITLPEGSYMPVQYATFKWRTHDGRTVEEVNRSLTFIVPRSFISETTIDANLSSFPPLERSYSVTAQAGPYQASMEFHVCSKPDRLVMQQDFQEWPQSLLPPDWIVEAPGYPGGQWIEELAFEGGNRVLRMTSYRLHEARLAHRVNISSDHIQFSFRVKVWEEVDLNASEPAVMAFGIVAGGKACPLLRLGKEEVLPFGLPYYQRKWTDIDVFLDLGTANSSSSCYIDGVRAGMTRLAPIKPEEIDRVYFLLEGTSYYVAQIDDLLFQEYRLATGSPYHPASTTMDVWPSHGQWFDPSSFVVRYRIEVTPRMPSNPYLEVEKLRIELWNSTSRLGILGTTSWNGSTQQSSPCEVFTHNFVCAIPSSLIDARRMDGGGFHGQYVLKSEVDSPSLPLARKTLTFQVDDPLEAYFSLWRGGPRLPRTVLERAPMNISLNVEFDPRPGPGNINAPFTNKTCVFRWIDPEGRTIRTASSPMKTDPTYPSNRSWAFDSLRIDGNSTLGTYSCLVEATCNSGYAVRERYSFILVVREGPLLGLGVLACSASALVLRRRRGTGQADGKSSTEKKR